MIGWAGPAARRGIQGIRARMGRAGTTQEWIRGMRQVGTIADETMARRLADYLLTVDVEAEVRPAGGSGWGVWVTREDDLERGRGALSEFLVNPDDPKYRSVARPAQELRRRAERAEREHRRRSIELRDRLNVISPARCPVTHALIVGSVLVALLTSVGRDTKALLPFYFAPPQTVREWKTAGNGSWLPKLVVKEVSSGLGPIRRGEVWRLWTPMFIHYGWMHLIFNMIMLHRFGGVIELRKGPLVLLGLVLASGPASFVTQYFWDVRESGAEAVSLPGGMSGVIYALFGYAWMKSVYDPDADIRVPHQTVNIMLIWLVACMSGLLGPIANAAHVGGLAVGLLVGVAPHLWSRG